MAFKCGTKGLKPFAAWSCELLPLVAAAGMGHSAGLCLSLSTHCNINLFSFAQPVGMAQVVSGCLSEETVPYVAMESVCLWEEMNSGSSYVAILNQNLVNLFLR